MLDDIPALADLKSAGLFWNQEGYPDVDRTRS
jgi:hypothetical protein